MIRFALISESPNRSTQPGRRVGGRIERGVELDRIDLLGDRRDGLEQVLNSVVTDDASIMSWLVIRCGLGSLGELKDMYLLPNTVVALTSATTFLGMNSI